MEIPLPENDYGIVLWIIPRFLLECNDSYRAGFSNVMKQSCQTERREVCKKKIRLHMFSKKDRKVDFIFQKT